MSLIAEEISVTRGSSLVADTTAETKTAVIDTTGFEEFTWVVDLGDVDAAAVLTFTVKENSANSTTSPTPTAVNLVADNLKVDGAVTAVTTTGAAVLTESSGNLDNKLVQITVDQNVLSKQYIFLSITATVESYEVNSIVALKCRPRKKPITLSTDVVSRTISVA